MNLKLYNALKRAGHSPAKAAEIELDVRRCDKHALAWVEAVLRSQRRSKGTRS